MRSRQIQPCFSSILLFGIIGVYLSTSMPSVALTTGDRCEVTTASLKVRDAPAGTDMLSSRSLGERGTVISGPESATLGGIPYQWYLVLWDNVLGWSAGDYLAFAPKPTITISAASNVGSTSVTLNGSVNANNNICTPYFEYGTSASYGNATEWISDLGGNSTWPLNYAITGLNPDTLYHVTLTVLFGNGVTLRGSDMTFRTAHANQPPIASTGSGSPQGENSALMSGTVNPQDDYTYAWFEWGGNTSYGSQTPLTGIGSGSSSIAHEASIGGLAYGATYHFRLVAQNNYGTTYGGDRTFTMPIQRVSVQTLAANNIQKFSSALNGNVNPHGNPCSMWFEWGSTSSYGNRTPGSSYSGSGSSELAFTETITGLEPGKIYHFRACGSNTSGTSYGSDSNFQAQYRANGALLTVAPDGTTSFGSIKIGRTSDQTFAVFNSGSVALSGTATAGEPFCVIAGGSYTLSPGQTRTVTVRYAPYSAGNHSAVLTFTGGGGQTRQVTGSAFSDPVPTTGEIVGRVISAQASNQPLNGIKVRAWMPTGSISDEFGGVTTVTGGTGEQAGSFKISGLPPSPYYHVEFEPPMHPIADFYADSTYNVSVQAGQTTMINMELTPIEQVSLPPMPTPENTPVVLVRGRGDDVAWEDGENESWATLRTTLVSQGITNVWDCNEPDADAGHIPSFPIYKGQGHVIDGTKGIQDNGWRLEYFVRQKTKQFKRDNGYYPSSVNIVAHSMGGLITRRALIDDKISCFADDEGKWVTVKVDKVIMLGTPNAGSRLADAAVLNGVPVPGWPWDWASTRDLKTDYMRNKFNAVYKWPTGVQLYLAGGTGGVDSQSGDLFWGWTYLGAHPLLFGDEKVSDGAVTWPSVAGKYIERTLPFMNLKEVTSVSLHPKVPPAAFYLDHYQIQSSQFVADWVVSAIKGAISGNSLHSLAGAKEQTSALFSDASLTMQKIASSNSTVMPGDLCHISVISDAATKLVFQFLSTPTGVESRLQTPSGALIDSTSSNDNPTIQYEACVRDSNSVIMTYSISSPEAGLWTAFLDGNSISNQAKWSFVAYGDSYVSVVPQTDALFNKGQDGVVSVSLTDLSLSPATPIENATIFATITFPDGTITNVALHDDGNSRDSLPSDGVYATVLANVQQAGDYAILYSAIATNSQTKALQRVSSGTFSVSSENASLWGDPAYETLDIDGDGNGDLLKVMCWVNPSVAGDYILSGDLVNAAGSRFGKSSQFSADGSGPMGASLMFDLSEIRAAGGDGNYHIEKLQLFEVSSNRVAWLAAYHGTSSIQLAPSITMPSPLPSGSPGVFYSQALCATGGVAPYSWSVVSNSLPDGLSLDVSSGVISGTPSGVTATSFVVQVSGTDGLFSMATFNLSIIIPPWFVSPTGDDANDGRSWETAKQTIQAAVDVAAPGDTIWVTNGVYNSGSRVAPGNSLSNRVVIDKPIEVRSVNGADTTIISGTKDPSGQGMRPGCGAQAIRCVWMSSGALISGFTITNGHTLAMDWNIGYTDDNDAGGIWSDPGSSAVISNCVIANNVAEGNGGGAVNGTLYNCTFRENSAGFGGGIKDGALYNCVLTGNSASYGGAAEYAHGLYMNNCVIVGNSANSEYGGVMGGTLLNCIVYYNNAPKHPNYDDFWELINCCTTPMPRGSGNLTNEPSFLNYVAGDLRLSDNSPCINAGQNQGWMDAGTDMAGTNRILYGIVDMGAYEFSEFLPAIPVRLVDLSVPSDVLRTNQSFFSSVTQILPVAATDKPITIIWTPEPVSGQGTTQACYNFTVPGLVLISVTVSNSDGGLTVGRPVHIALEADTFVSSTGDDSNDGFSENAAKKTIQAAVDGTLAGYTVWVGNGVYSTGGKIAVTESQMNRVMIDRSIRVQSVNGPKTTVIVGQSDPNGWDGRGDAAIRGVWLTNGAALVGFTVSNGYSRIMGGEYDTWGGGVWCASTSEVLSNCELVANVASYGGGVSRGTLYNCILRNNSANNGGGAYLSSLYDSVLTVNETFDKMWGNGGGALDSELYNCSLADNRAGTGGGSSGGVLRNCIVYYNVAQNSANWSAGDLSYCCTTPLPDGVGNLTNEPGILSLCNPRLLPGSLCVDRGTNLPWMAESVDLDGEPRIVNENVDIGADELSAASLTGTISGAISARYIKAIPNYIIPFTAALDGRIDGISLDFGDGFLTRSILNLEHEFATTGSYDVVLTASNVSGHVSVTAIVQIVSANCYVAPNGYDSADGTSWNTAMKTLQNAVDSAPVGGTLWVSNGIYAVGGRPCEGGLLTNRMVLGKPITVRGACGPTLAIIVGQADPVETNGDSAVRCVWMGDKTAMIDLTLSNGHTRLTHVYSRENNGGGVFCSSTNSVLFNCVLTENGAGADGGGVYGGTLYNCLLTGNDAVFGGGADASTIFSSVLTGNSAVSGGGAVSSSSVLHNCTLTGNRAAYGGGAYFSMLDNCIVYYNSAPDAANFKYVGMNYCCTMPDPGGIGNITNVPGIESIATPRLLSGSVCVNAGINQDWMGGTIDLDGTPRIIGGLSDIGAYEYPNTLSGLNWRWLKDHHLALDGSQDSVDTDGDGFTTWQEWLAGTDPTNSESVFRLTGAGGESELGVVIRWPSVSNRFYDLSRATNLLAGTNAFTILPGASNLPATPSENSYTDSVEGVGPYFYKVEVHE